jgi:guanylate kinase
VSYTTRPPRINEKHGVDYFFVEKDTFEREVEKNKFLEYNKVHENYYGTHRDVVGSIVNSGKICILDIDVQGVKMAMSNGLTVAYRMFLTPPSLDILKQRLIDRNTDSLEAIEKRVQRAAKEIELAHQLNLFHVFVTNDDKEPFLQDCMGVIRDWYPFLEKNKK